MDSRPSFTDDDVLEAMNNAAHMGAALDSLGVDTRDRHALVAFGQACDRLIAAGRMQLELTA